MEQNKKHYRAFIPENTINRMILQQIILNYLSPQSPPTSPKLKAVFHYWVKQIQTRIHEVWHCVCCAADGVALQDEGAPLSCQLMFILGRMPLKIREHLLAKLSRLEHMVHTVVSKLRKRYFCRCETPATFKPILYL